MGSTVEQRRCVARPAAQRAHAAEKGKTIKGLINDYLTGENGRAKRDHWVPRWMAFPPSAYTTRGGVATVTAANRAKWLAEADEPVASEPEASGDLPEPGEDAAEALDERESEQLAA